MKIVPSKMPSLLQDVLKHRGGKHECTIAHPMYDYLSIIIIIYIDTIYMLECTLFKII